MSWIQSRIRSFGHAFRGIYTLLKEQNNAQIHALATVVVLGAAWFLEFSRYDTVALLLVVALVWLAEGLNTALEYLADAAVPERHPLIKKAKDVAAGAVLITAVIALALGVLLFLPYLRQAL